MKSSTLLAMILVLQAALVMGIAFAAADELVNPVPPGKFPCCNNCKDEFSGLVSCGDVHTKCHPKCDKCQEVQAKGSVKLYKCADLYQGSCGHPCKHRN